MRIDDYRPLKLNIVESDIAGNRAMSNFQRTRYLDASQRPAAIAECVAVALAGQNHLHEISVDRRPGDLIAIFDKTPRVSFFTECRPCSPVGVAPTGVKLCATAGRPFVVVGRHADTGEK